MPRFTLTDLLGHHHDADAPLNSGAGGSMEPPPRPKISGIGPAGSAESIESRWKRPLHANGTGATHVRTFTGKLNTAGLEYMDKHINDWLDNHPNAEVKFANLTVGEFSAAVGKEATLVVQVWI